MARGNRQIRPVLFSPGTERHPCWRYRYTLNVKLTENYQQNGRIAKAPMNKLENMNEQEQHDEIDRCKQTRKVYQFSPRVYHLIVLYNIHHIARIVNAIIVASQ